MTSLKDLLHTVFTTSSDDKSRSAVLLDIIRKNKYWPALQMKKFFSDPDLVLLHNTYKREDTEHFKELYNECRSVVLNMAAPEGDNVVVTYADAIPERMTDTEYEAIKSDSDIVEMGFEGTMVTVYNHNGVWHFGTSSCPTVDSSRFSHPTKTHGRMFDEALSKILGEPVPVSRATSMELRAKFTEKLDANKAYAFLLVHHDNKHVMDYTSLAGENYAFLVHISTRDRVTLESYPLDANIMPSINYAASYASPDAGLAAIRDSSSIYALIVKRDNKLFKVSTSAIIDQEEKNFGNSNKWQNMLYTYINTKKRPDYKVENYRAEHAADLEIPKTSRGRELAPTYLIHTIICNMRDVLLAAYGMTTAYNVSTKRYKIKKDLDDMYPPIIRFHLAQLRHLQATEFSERPLTPSNVYTYICHRQTMKNLRLLIKHFATACRDAMNGYMSIPYGLPYHVGECFVILDGLLSA